MRITTIAESTYQLSMNLEGVLFEGVWDIPNGVSLNSYIIKGEKTAIIDGFTGAEVSPESLLSMLECLEINPKSIEYLVVNHMEPDHSGWLKSFKKINPDFKILCSKKAKDLLEVFYGHTDNIQCVTEGDEFDLGNGHLLKFIEIPNVHWPDTIATFDQNTGVLFPCDLFGSFGRINDSIYADEQTKEQLEVYENDMVRYFSNVLATFSPSAKKAAEKCETLPVKVVAPGHGLIYRNPEEIIEKYIHFADYQKGKARKEITMIWGSMYGMTEKAVKYIEEIFKDQNVKLNVHKIPDTSWGTVLTSVWTSTGIILAMPTYEYKMFPPIASVLEEIGKKKAMGKKCFRTGSYGWSGGAQKELDEIMERHNLKWDFLPPVEFNGVPGENDYALIKERVLELISEVKLLTK